MTNPMTTAPAHAATPRSGARAALLLWAPPALFLAVAVGAGVSLVGGAKGDEATGPVAQMRDAAQSLSAQISDTASAGIAKTTSLAKDERLAGVIATGDRSRAETFANELLQRSLELDIVAIFGPDGALLGVNTRGRDGEPIAPSALAAVYGSDFSNRDVVQKCLRDESGAPRVEFQTLCDFTPPWFGSSGLSVAFSAPVFDGAAGRRVGVVSTRLNFNRITALIRDNSVTRSGNAALLVSDDGLFFDEEINSGRAPAPLSPEQVRAAINTGGDGATSETVVHRDGLVLLGRSVSLDNVTGGGGINVLIRASEAWALGEERRAKLLAGAALAGALAAGVAWALYTVARSKRRRAESQLSVERIRTALVLENVSEGVIAADADGIVRLANRAASDCLGATAAALEGATLSALLPHGSPAAGPWRSHQTVIRRPDGAGFAARVVRTPLPDGSGIVLTFSDLTERLATDQRLLEATRKAGMAEVAAGVLHNVGNVLNSVNVAACLVADRLRGSEADGVAKAGGLLQEHREDLGGYLANDERGKRLPEYLIEAAKALGAEQTLMLKELEAVTKGIEHVKHIVHLQQEHAGSPVVEEVVNPVDLIETALRLQTDSLARHEVTVERRYQPVPEVLADKHLVLQVLVNLIANAKQALRGAPAGSKKLVMGVRMENRAGAPVLCFEVSDNGVGIAPDCIGRIFAQGFTTKRDGHGIGLHSAANAAAQMGGSLSVRSDGLGSGARFELAIPALAVVPESAAA